MHNSTNTCVIKNFDQDNSENGYLIVNFILLQQWKEQELKNKIIKFKDKNNKKELRN